MTTAQKMFPINLDQEKQKFYFDPLYNPQFVYKEHISQEELEKYGPFGGELKEKALTIVKEVLKKWGSESAYLEAVEGPILTKEETQKIITEYLVEAGLSNDVTVSYTSKQIPRTQIFGREVSIRLPIDYRQNSLRGILHHEIGTHILRRINDEKQPWHNKRDEYHLGPYLETEEGLASLHTYLETEHPYMWMYAIQYYACYLASTMSFVQVYEELKKYIDTRDRRWKITLRAKRGLTDTSRPGGFTKDQLYLRGVQKIAEWLQLNDYNAAKLFIGKLSLEDIEKVASVAEDNKLILPIFLQSDPVSYKKRVKDVLKVNGI